MFLNIREKPRFRNIEPPLVPLISDIKVFHNAAGIKVQIETNKGYRIADIDVPLSDTSKIKHEMMGRAIFPVEETDRKLGSWVKLNNMSDNLTPDYIYEKEKVILEIGTVHNESNIETYYKEKEDKYKEEIAKRNAYIDAENRATGSKREKYRYLIMIATETTCLSNFEFSNNMYYSLVSEFLSKFAEVRRQLSEIDLTVENEEDDPRIKEDAIFASLSDANVACFRKIPESDDPEEPLLISRDFIEAVYKKRSKSYFEGIDKELKAMFDSKTWVFPKDAEDAYRIFEKTIKDEIKKKSPNGTKTTKEPISNFCMICPKTPQKKSEWLKQARFYNPIGDITADDIKGESNMAIFLRYLLTDIDRKNFPPVIKEEVLKASSSTKELLSDEEYEKMLASALATLATGSTAEKIVSKPFREYINKSVKLFKPEFENKPFVKWHQVENKEIKNDLGMKLFLAKHGVYRLNPKDQESFPTFASIKKNLPFALNTNIDDIISFRDQDFHLRTNENYYDFYSEVEDLENVALEMADTSDGFYKENMTHSLTFLKNFLRTKIGQSLSLISQLTMFALMSIKKLPPSKTSWTMQRMPGHNVWLFSRVRIGNNTKELCMFYVWSKMDFEIIKGPFREPIDLGNYQCSSIFSLDQARIMNHVGIDLRFCMHMAMCYEDFDLITQNAIMEEPLTSRERERFILAKRVINYTLMLMLEGKKNTGADSMLNRYLICGSLSEIPFQTIMIASKYSCMLKSRMAVFIYNGVFDTVRRHLINPPRVLEDKHSRKFFEEKKIIKIQNLYCYITSSYQTDITHFINWHMYQGFYLAASAGSEVFGNKEIVNKSLKVEIQYLIDRHEERMGRRKSHYMDPNERKIPDPETLSAYESSFKVKLALRDTLKKYFKKKIGKSYKEAIWLEFVSELAKINLMTISTFKASAVRNESYEPIKRDAKGKKVKKGLSKKNKKVLQALLEAISKKLLNKVPYEDITKIINHIDCIFMTMFNKSQSTGVREISIMDAFSRLLQFIVETFAKVIARKMNEEAVTNAKKISTLKSMMRTARREIQDMMRKWDEEKIRRLKKMREEKEAKTKAASSEEEKTPEREAIEKGSVMDVLEADKEEEFEIMENEGMNEEIKVMIDMVKDVYLKKGIEEKYMEFTDKELSEMSYDILTEFELHHRSKLTVPLFEKLRNEYVESHEFKRKMVNKKEEIEIKEKTEKIKARFKEDRIIRCLNSKDSIDMETWCQQFEMRSFFCILSAFISRNDSYLFAHILNMFTKKKVQIPDGLLDAFTENPDFVDSRPNINILKSAFLGRAENKFKGLMERGKGVMRESGGMHQGILHLTSSIFNVACHKKFQELFLSWFNTEFAGIRKKAATFIFIVSSDDVAIDKNVAAECGSEVWKKMVDFVNRMSLFYKSFLRLTLLKVSEPKSARNVQMKFLEYNQTYFRPSEWRCLSKMVNVVVSLAEVDSIEKSIQNHYNKAKSLIESGGTTFLTRLAQHCQLRMHYIAMGSWNSILWDNYSTAVSAIRHPSLGFFPLDPYQVCSMLGYPFAFYLTLKQSRMARAVDAFMYKSVMKDEDDMDLLSPSIKMSNNFGGSMRFLAFRTLIKEIEKILLPNWKQVLENEYLNILSNTMSADGYIALVLNKSMSSAAKESFCKTEGLAINFLSSAAYRIGFKSLAVTYKKEAFIDGQKVSHTFRKSTSLLNMCRIAMINGEPKPESYLASRFSADVEYSRLLDELSKRPLYIADRFMKVEEKHKKLRASRLHIFKSPVPMRLSFITKKMWSGQDTRRRYFDIMKTKLPFLADTAEETLKRSPFETMYQLCLFINNYIPKTKNIVVFGYHKKKKQFNRASELLLENNRLNYLKHYECRVEESFARKTVNGEIRTETESILSSLGLLQESIALSDTKDRILENFLEIGRKLLLPYQDLYIEMPVHMKIFLMMCCAKVRDDFFTEMLSNPDVDLTYFIRPGEKDGDRWTDSILFVKRGNLSFNCMISESNRIYSVIVNAEQKSVLDLGTLAEILKEVCSMMQLNFGPKDARFLGFISTILLSSGKSINSDTLFDGVILQFSNELFFPDLISDETDVVLTREFVVIMVDNIPFMKLDCRKFASNNPKEVVLADQKDKLLEKWLNKKSMKADDLLGIVIDAQINYNRYPEKPGVKALMYWLAMRLRNFLYLESLSFTIEEKQTLRVMAGEETSKSMGKLTLLERSVFADRVIKQKSSFNYHPLFRNLLQKDGIREAIEGFWKGERIENKTKEMRPLIRLLKYATEDNGCQEEYKKSSLDFNASRVLAPNLSQSEKRKFFGILNREKRDYKEKIGSLLDSSMNILKQLSQGKENNLKNSIIMNSYLNLAFPGTDHRVELQELSSSDISMMIKMFDDPDSILDLLEEKKVRFDQREEDEEDLEGMDLDDLLDMMGDGKEEQDDDDASEEEKAPKEEETTPKEMKTTENHGELKPETIRMMRKKDMARAFFSEERSRKKQFSKEELLEMHPTSEEERMHYQTTSFMKPKKEKKNINEINEDFNRSFSEVPKEPEFRDSWEDLTGDQIAVGELMLDLPDIDL
jgi:hypothetical protein